MDVSDNESVRAAVETAVSRFGRIDILSNTAGAFDQYRQTLDTPRELWDKLIHPDGDLTGWQLPVSQRALDVANGKASGYYTDTRVGGVPVRELVVPTDPVGAILTVAPLHPTKHALARIRFWILLVGGAGIALAAALAAAVATAALRPVRRLTAAAENVAATGSLRSHVRVLPGR